MRNQGQIFAGVAIILIGVILALGVLLDVDLGFLCWPVGFILLGVWLLLRPWMVSADTAIRFKLLGDFRRSGEWEVGNEEFWLGIGDVRLDMAEASIPPGETTLRFFGFVGDVRLYVPQGIGLSVSSTAFITDARILGVKRESVFGSFHWASDGFEMAERRIRLELVYFISSPRIERA